MSEVTVFSARRIVTLNRSTPTATHMAVRDGRVLGLGGPEMLDRFGPARFDDRFAGRVLTPGFVEGHGHAMSGKMWRNPYVGYFPRTAPDGAVQGGHTSIAEVVAVLKSLETKLPEGAPLVTWGFDPIYFEGPRLSLEDLDSVSTTRPVLVAHASGHIYSVNSVVMDRAGFSVDSNIEGLLRNASGGLAGEILGPAAMPRAARAVGPGANLGAVDLQALRDYAALASRAGVTTATDLSNVMDDRALDQFRTATDDDDFPLRLVPALHGRAYPTAEGIARLEFLKSQSTDKLHFGVVKFTVDGSIQGFTARLRWPGYHNGAPNGLWYIAPAEFEDIALAWHRAGHQLHVHTNGDEASDMVTEMIARAQAVHPRFDHRHTLQHCQMADEAIFRRMAANGMCVNLFANHLYYWGDQHAAVTMGPTRAERLDPCALALATGVPLAIHSDTPVTPLDPLFTMQCAATRRTASGRLLGEAECIPADEALRATTWGPAYTLKLDHMIGTLDVGKFADCAILGEDPLAVPAKEIGNVPVLGTILGGRVFETA